MFTPSHRTKATATRHHSSQYESLRPIKKRRLSRVIILCLVGVLIIVAVFLAGKLPNQAKVTRAVRSIYDDHRQPTKR